MTLCNNLETEINKLQSWENGLRIASGELGDSHRQGRFKFDAKKLFLCLRHVATSCKFKVRAIESLLGTVKEFVELSLPTYLSNTVVQQLERTPMPKKSTLHVYELALVVAFMGFLSDGTEVGEQVARYYLSDASPVANQDWLWSQFVEIRLGDLLDVYQAVSMLQGLAGQHDSASCSDHNMVHMDTQHLHMSSSKASSWWPTIL